MLALALVIELSAVRTTDRRYSIFIFHIYRLTVHRLHMCQYKNDATLKIAKVLNVLLKLDDLSTSRGRFSPSIRQQRDYQHNKREVSNNVMKQPPPTIEEFQTVILETKCSSKD